MPIEEISLIHHTHVDVGYTDLQPIIYEKHVEYLEQVLDLPAAEAFGETVRVGVSRASV